MAEPDVATIQAIEERLDRYVETCAGATDELAEWEWDAHVVQDMKWLLAEVKRLSEDRAKLQL